MRRLDGSRTAERLGVYYFACARKPSRQKDEADSMIDRAA
jgi:hypothetical protein